MQRFAPALPTPRLLTEAFVVMNAKNVVKMCYVASIRLMVIHTWKWIRACAHLISTMTFANISMYCFLIVFLCIFWFSFDLHVSQIVLYSKVALSACESGLNGFHLYLMQGAYACYFYKYLSIVLFIAL